MSQTVISQFEILAHFPAKACPREGGDGHPIYRHPRNGHRADVE
jgi:hypothetical protein